LTSSAPRHSWGAPPKDNSFEHESIAANKFDLAPRITKLFILRLNLPGDTANRIAFPIALRRYFLYYRDLLSDLSRCAWESLKRFFQEAVPEKNPSLVSSSLPRPSLTRSIFLPVIIDFHFGVGLPTWWSLPK
jgi:hypothetical protein